MRTSNRSGSRPYSARVSQTLEPPDTDPYVRWCGRGGVARLPPIPIAARLSASRTKKAPPASGAQVGTPWMWTLAFGHHEDRTDTRLCRDARGRDRAMEAWYHASIA